MINRKLIRIKTVQVVYAYTLNEVHSPENGVNILLSSLGTAYDLYNTMLTLMVDISRLGLRAFEAQAARATRLGLPAPSRKFIDNRFMLQLESNVDSYEEDRELWRKIYRHIIIDNDSLDDLLEDVNLYWNDDRFIIDTFVLKTINRFSSTSKDDYPLLPEFRDEEELEYAKKLVSQALRGADYYKELIAHSTRNWDVDRVPLMDRIIMQVALAEITSFPSIPLSVSINEYIEIAKSYSTPNSARYINATLDNISKQLIAEHKLVKEA